MTKTKKQTRDTIEGNLALAIVDLRGEIDAIKDQLDAPPTVRNVEQEAFHLIGLWVTEQRDNGAATIDGAHLDAVREGIRTALSVR